MQLKRNRKKVITNITKTMKKALLFLTVLCMAGVFSAKAQSPSDSAYARDLSYTFLSTSSLPNSVSGSIDLSGGSKILKDVHTGKRANGYAITVSQNTYLDIQLTSGGWDSYLFLLDANFNEVTHNDDWNGNGSSYGSHITQQVNAGQYFILVSEYNFTTVSRAYTLSVDFVNVTPFNQLTYTTKTLPFNVIDTFRTTDANVILNNNAFKAKGYSFQGTQGNLLRADSISGISYYLLLDNNYNVINTTAMPYTGTYYLVVCNTNASMPFKFKLEQITITPLNQLNYTPLTLPCDVRDTFRDTDPNVALYGNGYKAKGYSFQGTQGNFIKLDSITGISNGMLLDNNYNEIPITNSILRLSYTGTYHLVLGGNHAPQPFRVKITPQTQQTIYVDGVNGSDSRNGLTPQTALLTLDTAIARTGGIGKYYITDNYTFRNQTSLRINYAEIYPYQKDINLKIASSAGNDILTILGTLIFGENGGNYHFILDSNSNQDYDDFIDADNYGSHLEVNNLKVRNTHFPSQFIWGDEVILRNCEFTNDTIEDDFILIDYNAFNTIKFENCSFSQNIFESDFTYFDYDSAKVTFENTTVSGNTFEYPFMVYANAEVNLTSGSWSGNTLSSDFGGNGNPNISRQTAAGIWAMSSTVNFGADFSMDANNFLCIDTASILNVNQNITASSAATVYPWKIDPSTNKAVGDYYEGRTLLSGSAVAANYRKFSVAQADNSTLWYLHPDGTIHTFPVSIDQAEEGTISLYPNPASDVLNIALQGSEVNEVVVIDIYGKAVAHATVAEGSNTMDISALPAGMYFVQLKANNRVKATQKIVKR